MFAQLLHVFSLLYDLHDTFHSTELFKLNVLNLAYFSMLSMQRNTRKILIGSLNWRQSDMDAAGIFICSSGLSSCTFGGEFKTLHFGLKQRIHYKTSINEMYNI